MNGRRHRYYRRKKPKSRYSTVIKLGIVIAIFLIISSILDARLRPVIENIASYQVKVFAAKSINQAMLSELDDSKIDYDDLIKITQNKDGMVTSVQSNMVKINQIKGHISQSIAADLEQKKQQSINIPLGTLLGNEWLSGRGPRVNIKVIPTGYVQSEIYNQFTTAGINQTNHQIMMRTTVRMIVIIPGYTVDTDTSSNFCIAETVIVGTIPDSFTQVNGDDSPTISKINDYSAEK